MYNKPVFLFLLLFSLAINAQNLNEKMASSFCECFGDNKKENQAKLDLDLLEKCMEYTLKINQKEFKEYFAKKVDTTKIEDPLAYKLGYDIGKEMFSSMQETLVYKCDSYYQFTLELSSLMQQNFKKDANSNQQKIDSLSNLIKKNPQKISLIWERGTHKMSLDQHKAARLDFNICLEKNANYPPALFFMAWSYHLEEDYEKAIAFYEKLLDQKQELSGMGDIARMYLATLKRKQKEK
ncbi:hypothetical protein [Pseudotenacibaculum haliotis]|uniref:Tetratricopeptide repeat protein n=1 Tax=Pseudotenacibaculum haliotis TaxID=1862138 RepID=A0ABW5LTA9_9FLAO